MQVWHDSEDSLCNHCCHGKSSKYDTFWVCVCSLSYPACKAHPPYHIAICSLYSTIAFFHVSHKRDWKMLSNITCISICTIKTVWNISNCNKNSVRYYRECSQIFMLHTHDACMILIKFKFSQQIFKKKIPKFQISWKFTQWELRCFMQTDRWIDMMKNLKTIKDKYITLSIHS